MTDMLNELDKAYIQAETDLEKYIDNDFVIMGVLLILLGRIERILENNGYHHELASQT